MDSLYLPIRILPIREKLALQDKVISIGSCFSESIGQKLTENKISCFYKSVGTLYHPIPIFSLLENALTDRVISQIVSHSEVFYDLNYSSHMYGFSKDELSLKIKNLSSELKEKQIFSQWIIITPGTAWGYYSKDSDEIVANCHKQSSQKFHKKLTSPEVILEKFESWWHKIKKLNPSVKILFTISPVRHHRDGLIENNQSKSVLHLAIREMTSTYENCYYFPSYEIMIDHLRDYRFYKTDRIHPTEEAIDIIWNYLKESWFSIELNDWIDKWEPIRRSLAHRPIISQQNDYKKFILSLLTKLNTLPSDLVKHEIADLTNKLDSNATI